VPGGFHRIRHYGLLANGCRQASLALARELLAMLPQDPQDLTDAVNPPPTFVCRHCGHPMIILQTFTGAQTIRAPPVLPAAPR
jgi:hypothetical protein